MKYIHEIKRAMKRGVSFGRIYKYQSRSAGQLTWLDTSYANMGIGGNAQHLWDNGRYRAMVNERTFAKLQGKEQVVGPRGPQIVFCCCVKIQGDWRITNAVRTNEHQFQQDSRTSLIVVLPQLSHKISSASSHTFGPEAHHDEVAPRFSETTKLWLEVEDRTSSPGLSIYFIQRRLTGSFSGRNADRHLASRRAIMPVGLTGQLAPK